MNSSADSKLGPCLSHGQIKSAGSAIGYFHVFPPKGHERNLLLPKDTPTSSHQTPLSTFGKCRVYDVTRTHNENYKILLTQKEKKTTM